MKPGYYILEGHVPVEVELMTWARWIEDRLKKIVKQERIGRWFVSTVFLGLDHDWGEVGPPILFETMVFDEEAEEHYMDRYATWDEAESGHAHITAYITACGRPPGEEPA